jgi:ketosteroid isomerase-like protein
MTSYFQAIGAGDFAAAIGHFSDEVVGFVPGRSDLAGVYRGRQAVAGYLNTVIDRVRGDVRVERVDTLVGSDHVALMVIEHLGSGPGELVINRTNVYRIVGGEIVEIRIFEGDQYLVDEHLGTGPRRASRQT